MYNVVVNFSLGRGFIKGWTWGKLVVRIILPGWFDHLAERFFFQGSSVLIVLPISENQLLSR